MESHYLFTLLLFCCFLPNVSVQSLEFFVSNDGSDSWDGTAESNVAGSDVGPWKTMHHAIDEIRLMRPNPPTAEDHATLSVLPGKHVLPSELFLDGRDSFMTIRALYDDDETAISGAVYLTGEWTQEEGDILTTTFQGSCGEAFVSTQRLVPARSPNLEEISPNMNLALPPYNTVKGLLVETETCTRNSTSFQQSCPDEDRNGFIFSDEFSSNWTYLDQTRVLVFHSWIAEYVTVSNITENKVFFQEPLQHAPIGTYVPSSGWRFLIFNNFALLDMPGEYVCNDLGDGRAQFSYIPLEAQDPDLNVAVSQLQGLVNINQATNILLEGFLFERSSSMGVDGYRSCGETAVGISSSQNIVITDSKFRQIGITGVCIAESSNVQITRSVFTDIGYHGVMGFYNSESEMESNVDIMVDNNRFDGCGISSFWQPSCVWMAGYDNLTVRHNDLSNDPFALFRIRSHTPHGADYWDDVVEPTRDDYVFHVEFNHFHEYGLGILSDFGAVYIGT